MFKKSLAVSIIILSLLGSASCANSSESKSHFMINQTANKTVEEDFFNFVDNGISRMPLTSRTVQDWLQTKLDYNGSHKDTITYSKNLILKDVSINYTNNNSWNFTDFTIEFPSQKVTLGEVQKKYSNLKYAKPVGDFGGFSYLYYLETKNSSGVIIQFSKNSADGYVLSVNFNSSVKSVFQ